MKKSTSLTLKLLEGKRCFPTLVRLSILFEVKGSRKLFQNAQRHLSETTLQRERVTINFVLHMRTKLPEKLENLFL